MSIMFHNYLLNSMLVLSCFFCFVFFFQVALCFVSCVLKCFQLVLRTFGPVLLVPEPESLDSIGCRCMILWSDQFSSVTVK